ncbi:MAG: NAD-dependent DNA ligase LigA [Elusimicrobia bacterium]|nr:MAG: NAD-dependent DNA ligase LigA [Elusimicrobiota bacterium]KAF0155778.1 MAG: NAD-dependent DNA ligase LigA [Elusimicrobiota bacterium]
MKRLILAGAALLLSLPALAEDADLSIPAEQKTIELKDKDGDKKAGITIKTKGAKESTKKKSYKKKEKGSGYKFKAQDSTQYKFDGGGKPLTGGKKAAPKKKSKTPADSGYKFRQEGKGSSYKLDEEANPIGKTGAKKAPAPKKPAAKPVKNDVPPPYDDSLAVDKKMISLEGK